MFTKPERREDLPRKKVSPARCSAAGSLNSAVRNAFAVVRLEFGLRHDTFVKGDTCSSIRQVWEKECDGLLSEARGRRFRRARMFSLKSALSSTKRFWDASCTCDSPHPALKAWFREMCFGKPSEYPCSAPRSFARDPLWLLKRHVRELSAGWGGGLEKAREGEGEGLVGVYTPDQQGCLEAKAVEGGSLSVPFEEESLENNLTRPGVAKTKGKLRVVTMQSARVKRVLAPVHNALYNHLSSFGWLVRGDVQKDDFLTVVNDRREGEMFISGDYESATNMIHHDAVRAIVEVLCEDPLLSEEERRVLWESFDSVLVYNQYKRKYVPVKKGSMMGNLVSFPLLCLLNKACFDIACDVFYGPGAGRKGRFNGDDCVFPGSRAFFDLWVEVTGIFGLRVNRTKTSLSFRTLELNSNLFHVKRGRICAKPVLSFFKRKEDVPDAILPEILKGLSSFRRSTVWHCISLMIYAIKTTVVTLSDIPKVWLKDFLTRSWFRDCLRRGPPPVVTKGTLRTEKIVLGPVPRSFFYPVVDKISRDLAIDHVARWKGVSIDAPRSVRVDRSAVNGFLKSPLPPANIRVSRPYWTFLWPKAALEHFRRWDEKLWVETRLDKWIDDHPFLSTSRSWTSRLTRSALPRMSFAPPVDLSVDECGHLFREA